MSKSSEEVKHKVGTRKEWLAARLNLLKAEKEHTRRGDDLALQRQVLPWVGLDEACSDRGASSSCRVSSSDIAYASA